MIEVEQRSLRALEHDVLAVLQPSVQQRAGVGDVRLELRRQVHVLLDDPVGVEGQPVVDLREDQVLLAQDHVELLAEDLRVEQVLDAQPDPSGLVAVRGSDAALRRAQRVLPEEPLGHLLELQVVRHDQVGVAGHDQARDVDAQRAELGHLFDQMARVHDHAAGDHGRDVVIEDARRDELELQQAPLGDHRVARVVAALIADDEVHPVGEVVDRLALALVPPLGPEHDRGWHGVPQSRGRCTTHVDQDRIRRKA